VGYAPWPNETVSLLLERKIAGIAGNYDSTVALDYKHCGCKYEDPHQAELAHVRHHAVARAVAILTARVAAKVAWANMIKNLVASGHKAKGFDLLH